MAEVGFTERVRRYLDATRRGAMLRAAAGAPALAEPGRPLFLVERASESFDIWHEVPLVPQLTGMSCWAAAAAMIVGWRDCIDVRPEDVAHGTGAWEEYREGLEPRSVEALARTFGLHVETPRSYQLDAVRELLERYGPLWVGAGPTGLHVVVVTGMLGDGSPDGTRVRVLDPWPIGRGARYTLTFRELASALQTATDAAGVRASILHCGDVRRGRARGPSELGVHGRHRSVTHSRSHDAVWNYGTPLALFNLYRDAPPARCPTEIGERNADDPYYALYDRVTAAGERR